MVLPLATTTINLKRVDNDGTVDRVDQTGSPRTVAQQVRAAIVSPYSRTTLIKGQRVVTSAGFRADPIIDIQTGDILTDNTTGVDYQVLWANSRYELGLAYTFGDLLIVKGAPQ